MKYTARILSLGKLACAAHVLVSIAIPHTLPARFQRTVKNGGQKRASGQNSRTPGVEHALDNRAHHSGVSQHHKLEAVARDEGDVLAGSLRRRHAGPIEGEAAAKAAVLRGAMRKATRG